MNHNLLDVVEGVYQKPTVLAPVANPSNAAAVTSNTGEINEWMKMDIADQNCIVSTIEETVMRTIMNCTTSHLMWTRFLNQYELASMENKHLLMGKFMSYQYDSNHDIMIHIRQRNQKAPSRQMAALDRIRVLPEDVCQLSL